MALRVQRQRIHTPHHRCPYHAALQHLTFLKRHFPSRYREAGCPLFPDHYGDELQGERVVDFLEAIADLMGEPLRNKDGGRRFGKHSLRSTGAVHLSEMGLDISKIQLLGRWLCGVVLR